MIVSRQSPFTGKINEMDLDVTPAQLAELASPISHYVVIAVDMSGKRIRKACYSLAHALELNYEKSNIWAYRKDRTRFKVKKEGV
jgi:hypothetical protein